MSPAFFQRAAVAYGLVLRAPARSPTSALVRGTDGTPLSKMLVTETKLSSTGLLFQEAFIFPDPKCYNYVTNLRRQG